MWSKAARSGTFALTRAGRDWPFWGRGLEIAGISGMDEFIRGLENLNEQAGRLDGLTVRVDPTDSLEVVINKLRQEIRRTDALELPESQLRDIAQNMLQEARSQG